MNPEARARWERRLKGELVPDPNLPIPVVTDSAGRVLEHRGDGWWAYPASQPPADTAQATADKRKAAKK